MDTVTIGHTSKGRRIWLQGVAEHGDRYDVAYSEGMIQLLFWSGGKRKVTAAKGGIVDLCSQKVTRWADGAETATVAHGLNCICIYKGE